MVSVGGDRGRYGCPTLILYSGFPGKCHIALWWSRAEVTLRNCTASSEQLWNDSDHSVYIWLVISRYSATIHLRICNNHHRLVTHHVVFLAVGYTSRAKYMRCGSRALIRDAVRSLALSSAGVYYHFCHRSLNWCLSACCVNHLAGIVQLSASQSPQRTQKTENSVDKHGVPISMPTVGM